MLIGATGDVLPPPAEGTVVGPVAVPASDVDGGELPPVYDATPQ